MPTIIPIAHDFICPWCWVGLLQARRLQKEFDIQIEWKGYELFPVDMDWPDPSPAPETPVNKPATPTRLAFLLAVEGITMPLVPRPPKMRTHNAHQAVEFAKTEGVEDRFVEILYRAYWEEGRDINNLKVILELAHGIIGDLGALENAISTDQFGDDVVDFDDPAYQSGVYNVPTFFIGEARLAEQPYEVLRKATQQIAEARSDVSIYQDIVFPKSPEDRPYAFINMVSTIDGKILTGERDEPVGDLGSAVDHLLMHRLEAKADAVLVGANSLRATGNAWNPKTTKRIVVTRSGNIPWESEFLTNGEPIVLTSGNATFSAPTGVTVVRSGSDEIDWVEAAQKLRKLGITILNVLGGSEINAQLLTAGIIDELFLTLAPKIKLGENTPTYADGKPLPREAVQKYRLLEHNVIGDEIFLRYGK